MRGWKEGERTESPFRAARFPHLATEVLVG